MIHSSPLLFPAQSLSSLQLHEAVCGPQKLPAPQQALEPAQRCVASQPLAAHVELALQVVLPIQVAQASPLLPHAWFWLPAEQKPPRQQPPTQVSLASHPLVEQAREVSSHVVPEPHAAQSPLAPHAAFVVPGTHMPGEPPLVSQQAPLQRDVVSQVVVQRLLKQASPGAHWLELVQPHAPPTHAGPSGLFVHEKQDKPSVPQAVPDCTPLHNEMGRQQVPGHVLDTPSQGNGWQRPTPLC
jgi:hypothetical protein